MHVYIFVRRDLPPAQIVVQAAHSAIESARKHIPLDMEHPSIVLLGFRDQRELERAFRRVQSSGFQVCPFFEADRGDELTAFATQPVYEHQRSFFRRYNCLSDELLFSAFTSKNTSLAEGPSTAHLQEII